MLSPTQVKAFKAKPGNKVTKIADGSNLYLVIFNNGAKRWWYCYKDHGKQITISIGCYPEVSLLEAREKARELSSLKNRGVNLRDHIKAEKASKVEKAANTFGVICDEWLAKMKPTWAPAHAAKVESSLKSVKTALGDKPITDIGATDILPLLVSIQDAGAIETAHRVKGRCSEIFCYAVATGRAASDPTVSLKRALKPIVRGHRAAVVEPSELGKLLRILDGYKGNSVVVAALKLAPLFFVRPGELVAAKWSEISFEKKEWRYAVSKTARNGVAENIVPLSSEALEILRNLRPFCGDSEYLFPSPMSKTKHISTNALLGAIRAMGVEKQELCVHGFRAIARTLLEEELHYPIDVIEHQLAHVVRDPLGRAYNRTTHLVERHEMMERWSSYLKELRNTAI